MQANFMVYLMSIIYKMDQVPTANIINTWNAVSNVVPVIGAFVADACFGKFRTIAFASLASLTPEGSIFSKVAQLIVAAVHKRHVYLPTDVEAKEKDNEEEDTHGEAFYYDPPFDSNDEIKLPLTNRCLSPSLLPTHRPQNRKDQRTRRQSDPPPEGLGRTLVRDHVNGR
ncbi:hypothetical protein Ahy_A03g010973 isoform C [Arachis hypogaea]|uniref:Uncharacterized protein n=1 Tax=Arachis hypogaea TaxID=3818 RepID=A0A445DP51_ARAHY|nr:hypothetical protein Ahy_A03g010973 isoform C [Arachis hypogaea]